MIHRAVSGALFIFMFAGQAGAANSPPLSESWNIASNGEASSSGELLFRVTPGDGGDAVEVTVGVSSGTSDIAVAGSIRRAFGSQLRADQFNVEPGQGANVLVTRENDEADFSIELIDSDVESLRVIVQSASPVAPPTVPRHATPANSPAAPATPPAPGDGVAPANAPPPSSPAANSSSEDQGGAAAITPAPR